MKNDLCIMKQSLMWLGILVLVLAAILDINEFIPVGIATIVYSVYILDND